MENTVEYKSKSRTVHAIDLGRFIDPDEGLEVRSVPEGEMHTFREGQIAFIRCEGHWQKFGFAMEQTMEGPLHYAKVPFATMEDVEDQYKDTPVGRQRKNLSVLLCIPLFFAGLTFLGYILGDGTAFGLYIKVIGLSCFLLGFVSLVLFAFIMTKTTPVKAPGHISYWMAVGIQEHQISLARI